MYNRRSAAAIAGALLVSLGVVAATAPAQEARAQRGGDPVKGKQVFVRCSVCHSVDPQAKKLGPTLANVVNRRAGTVPGFRYSPAMKASKLTWTPQMLDKYLSNPKALVPGTSMVAPPVAAPADRANVIAYLTSVSKPAKAPARR